MAYDPKQREEKENPYAALAGHDVGSPIPDSMRPATASAAPLPGGEAGPTSTGHVNFDQIYNANAGTAAREANKLQTSARMQGQAVRTGVMGAQDQFGQAVRTGAMGGPNQSQQNWAKYGKTGSDPLQQKQVTSAAQGDAVTGKQGAYTETGQGLASPSYEDMIAQGWKLENGTWYPPGGASGNPDDLNPELSDEALKQQVEAGAGQTYGGPNALSDLGQYEQLLQDATAAQDNANALGKGNAGLQAKGLNQLDAALLGASGRRGFEDIAKDQSNLKGELGAANLASMGVADAEKKQREQDAAAYQGLLGEYGGRVASDQAEVDKMNKRSDQVIANGTAADEGRKKFKEYMGAARNESSDTLSNVRNQLHDVANMISPSEWIAEGVGGQGLVDFGTNGLSPMSSNNKGNVSDVWTEDDYDVWASMSDEDWAEFAHRNDKGKREFIDERKAKLAGGG